jgi:hypothetical protein
MRFILALLLLISTLASGQQFSVAKWFDSAGNQLGQCVFTGFTYNVSASQTTPGDGLLVIDCVPGVVPGSAGALQFSTSPISFNSGTSLSVPVVRVNGVGGALSANVIPSGPCVVQNSPVIFADGSVVPQTPALVSAAANVTSGQCSLALVPVILSTAIGIPSTTTVNILNPVCRP